MNRFSNDLFKCNQFIGCTSNFGWCGFIARDSQKDKTNHEKIVS